MTRNGTKSIKKRAFVSIYSLILGFFALMAVVELLPQSNRERMHFERETSILADRKVFELNVMFNSVMEMVRTSERHIIQTFDADRVLTDANYEENYMTSLATEMTRIVGNASCVIGFYFRMEMERFGGERGIFFVGNARNGFTKMKNTDIRKFSPTDTEHVGWYYLPVWAKRPVWTNVYDNKNVNIHMISYVIPVYKGETLLGVVGVDINFDSLKDIVDNMPLEDSLGMLVGRENVLLYTNKNRFEQQLNSEYVDTNIAVASILNSSGNGLRKFRWIEREYMGIIRPLENGMTFVTAIPSAEMYETKYRLVMPFVIVSLGALLICYLFFIYIRNKIVNPIRLITDTTSQIARGELNVTLPYESDDEIGVLAESIRKMIVQFKDYFDYVRQQAQKEREEKESAQEESRSKTDFLASMYISMHDVNLEDNTFEEVQVRKDINDMIKKTYGNANEVLQQVMKQTADKKSWRTLLPFVDLSTLSERMGDGLTVAHEFLGAHGKWCRGRFITMSRKRDGTLHHVLWVVEYIDEERKMREKLREEVEKAQTESRSKSEFLASMYLSMHDINLDDDTLGEVQARDDIRTIVNATHGKASVDLPEIMKQTADKSSWSTLLPFVDLSTLDERMGDAITLAHEFLGMYGLWCRGRFIVMSRREDGTIRHVLWAVENIDEERRSREALREEVEKAQAESQSKSEFLASMYVSLHEVDLNTDVFTEIHSRQDVAQTIGVSCDNARATIRRVMEIRVKSDGKARDDFMEFINFDTLEERMKDKITIAHEFYAITDTWCRARFILMDRNPDGTLHHVLWAVENINEERLERERLQSEAEKNAAANQAKSSFLANMSHEIRTPINAVLGMNEMILRESEDEHILEYAANIKTAGANLLGIVNEILDFSKIEAGKMELLPENYDVSSVIVDLVNMISERAKMKNLSFNLKADSSLPKTLYGDSVKIKQCILNVLTNAVKYTKEGSVTFTVGYRKLDEKKISLKISVKDTGIGIKKEDLSKLCSPFERIEEDKNRTIEGTGLGMSIITRYLTMMNSKLDVSSVYGKGSEFSFAIEQPVVDWSEIGDINAAFHLNAVHAANYKERLHAPRARLLFVDDTAMNLEVIKGLLKKTGIQIDTALSGRETLALVQKRTYDILFIDHRMPEMDGIETLHEMQKMKNNLCRGKPCIALTANAIAGVKQMYLDEGFTDYLSKPVSPDKLEDMIKKYLPIDYLEGEAKTDSEKDGDTPEKQQVNRMVSFVKNFGAVEGIEVQAALDNCGTSELLQSAVKKFYDDIDAASDELQRFLEAEDWKNYGTKIHALKSSARLIGAISLSKLAEHLEHAADNGDAPEIKEKHESLMQEYRTYKDKFSDLV